MSAREFGLDEENPEFNRIKTYKPSPQVTAAYGPDRVSFLSWPDLMDPNFDHTHMQNKNPRIVGGRRIYLKGVGYVSPRFSSDPVKKLAEENELIAMYCADDPAADSTKALQSRAITLVVVWPKEGSNKAPEVLPWLIPPTTLEEIKAKNQRFPLYANDLEVSAKQNGQFTNLKLEVAPNNLFAELLKKKSAGDLRAANIANAILLRARELSPVLAHEIGKDLSLAEVKQRRGHDRSSSPAPSEIASAVSGDVSSLVANILAD